MDLSYTLTKTSVNPKNYRIATCALHVDFIIIIGSDSIQRKVIYGVNLIAAQHDLKFCNAYLDLLQNALETLSNYFCDFVLLQICVGNS